MNGTPVPVESLAHLANYPPATSTAVYALLTQSCWKQPVRLASAGTVANLSSITVANFDGAAQGITLVANDRVLVKNNASPDGVIGTAAKYQGIYVVGPVTSGTAALTRDTDANTDAMVTSGMSVEVQEGAAAGSVYTLTTANPITLGTTSLAFSAQSAASPTAVSGTTFPATPAIGQVPVAQTTTSVTWSSQPGAFHTVRNLVLTNIASLASYTVAAAAANDNVSGGNVANDRVLLVGQTTPSQNGIYIVGTVSGGVAPLTRATDWLSTAVLPMGSTVAVNAGAIWANTKWFASVTSDITVGATAPAFCPESYSVITVAMTGTPGTFSATGHYILSATLSSVVPTVKTPGTQGFLSVGTLTAGLGTGSFTVTSTANETSTLYLTIRNR